MRLIMKYMMIDGVLAEHICEYLMMVGRWFLCLSLPAGSLALERQMLISLVCLACVICRLGRLIRSLEMIFSEVPAM